MTNKSTDNGTNPKDQNLKLETEEQGDPIAKNEQVSSESSSENSELEKALAKIKDLEGQLVRALADLQNVRKRAANERVELLNKGGQRVIEAILPSLDNFDRALSNLPPELEKNDWTHGVLATEKSLFAALKQEGLELIKEEKIPFNPEEHEAVVIDEQGKEGEVTQVLQRGFKLNGKTLRTAKVKVGGKK
jgi:molecular chaperone GrpE